MAFSLCLVALLEAYEEDVQKLEKSLEKRSERDASAASAEAASSATATAANSSLAGIEYASVLERTAVSAKEDLASSETIWEISTAKKPVASEEDLKNAFDRVVKANSSWLSLVIHDAVAYAKQNQPRADDVIERVLDPEQWKLKPKKEADAAASFAQAWQSLKNRGWKAETPSTGDNAGKTRYEFEGKSVSISRLSVCEAIFWLWSHAVLPRVLAVHIGQCSSKRSKFCTPRPCFHVREHHCYAKVQQDAINREQQ